MSKNTRTRILLTTVAALLLVCVAVGGTIAFLQAQSTTVTNTFTPTGIAIKLDESTYKPEDNSLIEPKITTGNTYELVPGKNLPKDPVVTVLDDETDVDLFVFLNVDKDWTLVEGETHKYYFNSQPDITFTVDTAWKVVPNETHVFYTTWANNSDSDAFNVIKDTTVYVANTLTETDMATIPEAGIELSFHAYAIQQLGFENDPAAAWNEVKTRETDKGTILYGEI